MKPLIRDWKVLIFGFVFLTPMWSESAPEFSGKVDLELTYFPDEGQFPSQDYRSNSSIAFEPEIYYDWNDGNDSVVFTPFVRIDERDDERTHADIRELLWVHAHDQWEFRTGIGKVFWGVTEFIHLVDIVNQTDTIESFDGEQKLGQPMFSVSRVTDIGIFDVFVLPGFRERTFPGEDGRLRFGLVVDTDNPRYESDQEEAHVDFAARWSNSISVFDIGVYGFRGTDRAPFFEPVENNGIIQLRPFYQQITQFGVDVQATIDSWLLKWESISSLSDREDFSAAQLGFEYTLYGIFETFTDLGILLEYGWDERGTNALSINQNDIYLGARLALNNTNDTAILFGGSYDLDFNTKSFLLEASQRLNDFWTFELDANIFIAGDQEDFASSFDSDDLIQLTLERHF